MARAVTHADVEAVSCSCVAARIAWRKYLELFGEVARRSCGDLDLGLLLLLCGGATDTSCGGGGGDTDGLRRERSPVGGGGPCRGFCGGVLPPKTA